MWNALASIVVALLQVWVKDVLQSKNEAVDSTPPADVRGRWHNRVQEFKRRIRGGQ